MENKPQLLKIGENIVFAQHGVDYKMEPNKVYTVDYDRYAEQIKLKEAPDLQLPSNLYTTKEDEKFMKRVLNNFSKSEKSTGVMLAGTKGTGKTVMAKQLALTSNLPIILIDKSLRPCYLKTLFNKLATLSVCVIFDELDKLGEDYDDDYMLQIFDGISSSGKHLIISTCNDTSEVNEYLLDRCSRIRYYKEFEEMSPSMIHSILFDRLNDKEEVKPLTDFIVKNFNCISFDNVASFAEEVNEYPSETFEELFKDMNISSKK